MKPRRALVAGFAFAGAAIAWSAFAQRVEPGRPRTVTVGASHALSPTDRIDARRSGFIRGKLPTAGLRTHFRYAFGQSIEHAPLTLDDGSIALVVNHNELVVLGPDRTPWFAPSLGSALGPLTALADGTIVTVTGAGEAVGVRHGAIRFRTRLGGERSLAGRISPLSLEDGGAVVATSTELSVLDAEGGLRARASVPEPLATPLLAAPPGTGTSGRVLALALSGAVYAWIPGHEVRKIGTFGGAVDGSAVLAGRETLLAVVDGTRLVALDLVHGTTVTRASVQNGLYLGPPAVAGETTHLLSMTPGRTLLVAVGGDSAGQELSRFQVSSFTPMALADGGAPGLMAPPHSGVLVDAAGTVAFATPEGFVGVASAASGVRMLGETPWATRITAAGKPHSGNIVGMAPSRVVSDAGVKHAGFVVVSESGNLVEVVGGT